ncbi:hypothetical protein LTLLF_157275 [Microtus ochrogaster]|uniref:Uncharacterized protein n=1 Tax=Microtus ochrogaster TaxID=79684 RepID=A0A8J6GEY4_MICOH|nr:hypothetical protein LTLLF_157275 [Microtus ochrogaster]
MPLLRLLALPPLKSSICNPALPILVPASVPHYTADLRPWGALRARRLLMLSGVRPPARRELLRAETLRPEQRPLL